MRAKSNNANLEAAIQRILDKVDGVDRAAHREIHVGPGMRSLHGDEENLLLEAVSSSTGSGSSCRKWQAGVRRKEDSSYCLVMRNGTVNGVLPSNVNEEVEFKPKELNYVLVETEITAEGSVTDCKIIVSEQNLAGSQADNQGYPPSPAYVLVGTIRQTRYKAELCFSVSLTPVNTRKTARDEVDFGQEPFDRWYKWEVRELEYAGD